jgi:hypothetical protein
MGVIERLMEWALWQQVVAGVITAAILAAPVFLWRLLRRPTTLSPPPASAFGRKLPFAGITVKDPTYHVEWHVQEDPKDWPTIGDAREWGSPYAKQVLAGPFHLDCRGAVFFTNIEQPYQDLLEVNCPRCHNRDDWVGDQISEDRLSTFRRLVISELQRLSRNGVELRGTITLDKPVYGF